MPTKPIHVAIMIQSLGVGGAEHAVINLINESDPAWVRFSLIVFSSNVPLLQKLVRSDVTICTVQKHSVLGRQFINDVVAVLADLKPDIVHTHLFTADVWGTIAARRLGIPTVSTEHNINREYGVARTLVKRWLRNTSSAYVACSDAVRAYMQRTYGVTKAIEVIPNGVLVDRFNSLPAPVFAKPLRLVVIGRLVEQKGHHILLSALGQLLGFSWQLDVVGEGVLLNTLQHQAKLEGIADRVRFVGVSDAIPDVLARQDVVVMPSLWEGLGVAAREAMAAGRLVVASKTGGLTEFVVSGKTGILVAPGDSAALARALRDVLEHAEDFKSVAQAGQVYARHHFGMQTMVDRYLAVYQRLV